MTVAMLASILGSGLLAGFLHAFDPDHLMTISAMSARSSGHHTARSCSVFWALGHGTILLLAAAVFLLVRIPLPAGLPIGAERLAGVILIVTGGVVLHALGHDGEHAPTGPGLRQRAPFFVGMVHGLAGSAAIFALLPLSLISPLIGLSFVALFSVGVLCGMLGFGIGFTRLQCFNVARGDDFARWSRGGIGVLAVAMGGYWLVGT